jgi:hypothetical protein
VLSSRRTAVIRDPYVRWCGRSRLVRGGPIPIIGLKEIRYVRSENCS